METTLIAWPAIIKYSGDAELAFVDSQSAWDADRHLHGARYEKSDALIDSKGEIYALLNHAKSHVQPEPTGKFASLDEVLELVRAHAAQSGACCVAKFSASSVEEAVRSVGAADAVKPSRNPTAKNVV